MGLPILLFSLQGTCAQIRSPELLLFYDFVTLLVVMDGRDAYVVIDCDLLVHLLLPISRILEQAADIPWDPTAVDDCSRRWLVYFYTLLV